jgi:hypothetical protein
MLDGAANRGVQRPRSRGDQLPQPLLEGGDAIHVERVGDRIFGVKMVEQRSIGDAASFSGVILRARSVSARFGARDLSADCVGAGGLGVVKLGVRCFGVQLCTSRL